MRTLILMRHAKTEAGNSQLPDRARRLTAHGRLDAISMAHWLSDQQLVPGVILASSATRVRETVDALRQSWSDPPPVHYSDQLYLAPPEDILRVIRSDALDGDPVLIVAHNPGLAALACTFAPQPLAMPTAAVVAFRADIDQWPALTSGSTTELVAYGIPDGKRRG